MTLYGVITAALFRKISALIAEYRKLVAAATAVEKQIVETAEAKAAIIIMDAKAEERAVLAAAEAATTKLKNELIDKIASI
jgi:hypothetical protein